MPFVQSRQQKQAEQKLFQELAKRLRKAHEEPADRARELVAVDTGALQRSIRVLGPVQEGDEIKVAIAAGSDEIDYAFPQEMLHKPFLRPVHENVWRDFKKL